jgi:hypothetical protein
LDVVQLVKEAFLFESAKEAIAHHPSKIVRSNSNLNVVQLVKEAISE